MRYLFFLINNGYKNNKQNRREQKNCALSKGIFSTLIIFVASCVLSGCTTMNSNFDCPMVPGVMCKSLDQVNNLVESGQLGKDDDAICPTCKNNKNNKNGELADLKASYGASYVKNSGDTQENATYKVKIWIAPYKDTDGNYHEESTIYVKNQTDNE